MSSARARGSATPPPELTPEREELLRVQAFALGLARGSEVLPRRESDAAPSLAMSKGAVAETWSGNKHTEIGLPTRVPIGDEVSPLTIDTSLPGSTGNPVPERHYTHAAH